MSLPTKSGYYLSIMLILFTIFRKNVCENSTAERQFCLENIATTLKHPTNVCAWPKGNKLIVSEHGGRIYLLTPESTGRYRRDIFLDITDRVLTSEAPADERGLLSFTLHPDFLNNGHLYVCYSAATDGWDHKTVVSRFAADKNNLETVDKGTEKTILEINQPGRRQNGGQIFFGLDSYMYITTGDGGDLANSRFNKSSLLGKILRIDVDNVESSHPYSIPADNPFVGEEGARREVYAYGFRNPWRCTVDSGDRMTGKGRGRIICGDNGEEEPNEEEIDLIVAGGRYGWIELMDSKCKTLEQCKRLASQGQLHPGDITPLHTYSHEEGQAIVGGIVYRGNEIKSLYGTYIYADFVHGSLHFLNQTTSDEWASGDISLQLHSEDGNCSDLNRMVFILGLSVDHNGEVIVMTTENLSNLSPTGALYRLGTSVKGQTSHRNRAMQASIAPVIIITFMAISIILKQF